MELPKIQNFRSHPSWKLIKVILYSTTFIGTSLLAFLPSISYLAVQPLRSHAPDASPLRFPAEVSLMVEALSVNPIGRTITMDWYPSFTAPNCTKDPIVLDILIAPSLLDSSSPTWTANPPYLPLYRLNSTEFCLGLNIKYPSFRTITKLFSSSTNVPVLPGSGQSTLQNYPFDVYIAPFTFNTQDVQTGDIAAPNITDSFGVAVNFELSLQQSFFSINEFSNLPVQTKLEIAFRVERSKATKMFVVMVAISNWLTAAAFLIMCAAALVYHHHAIYSEMFVVPVGAVFAFTSIRANFPGAPAGFGTTIDMYSTLPFLVIMSFCSFTLLLLILYRRIQDSELRGQKLLNKEENSRSSTLLDTPVLIDTERSSTNEIMIEEKSGSSIQDHDIEKQQLGGDALRRLRTL